MQGGCKTLDSCLAGDTQLGCGMRRGGTGVAGGMRGGSAGGGAVHRHEHGMVHHVMARVRAAQFAALQGRWDVMVGCEGEGVAKQGIAGLCPLRQGDVPGGVGRNALEVPEAGWG